MIDKRRNAVIDTCEVLSLRTQHCGYVLYVRMSEAVQGMPAIRKL